MPGWCFALSPPFSASPKLFCASSSLPSSLSLLVPRLVFACVLLLCRCQGLLFTCVTRVRPGSMWCIVGRFLLSFFFFFFSLSCLAGRFLIGFGVYILLQSAMVAWRGTTPYLSAPLYTRTPRCRVQMTACHLSGTYGAADFCRNRVSNGPSYCPPRLPSPWFSVDFDL